MDHDYDPVVGFARAAEAMAATQRVLGQTQQLRAWFLGGAVVLIGFCLLFTGYLVWQHRAQGQEHAALTQALIATLQRLPKP